MEILRTSYFVATIEGDPSQAQLIRVVRSARAFLDIPDVSLQHNLLIAALDRAGRKNRYLIVDLRNAPARSDPAFETAMAKIRPRMVADFRRIGILTKTAPGTLQVSRHMNQDGIMALISTSESELLSFFRINPSGK